MKNSCVYMKQFTEPCCTSFPTAGFMKLIAIFAEKKDHPKRLTKCKARALSFRDLYHIPFF